MKLTKRLNRKVNPKFLFLSLSMLGGMLANGQVLTLEECQKKAQQISPLKKQEQYIASLDALNKQLVQTSRLPGIELQGRASYQSDVFGLPFSLPGAEVPVIPKDQYQLTLNVNQSIYDGGTSRAASTVENANSNVRSAQLNVSLYQIREIINELYFGILTLEESAKINESITAELDNQLRRAQSAVKNGILLPSELKSLQKQKLTNEQQQNDLQLRRVALLKVLGDWIGAPSTVDMRLVMPVVMTEDTGMDRPELKVFSMRIEQLKAQQNLISAQNRPKVQAFATTGYGSPNPYNFFQTDWNNYYLIGGTLKWQPWDWNRNKKQRKILGVNQDILLSEQENFEKNIQNQLIQQQSEIELLEASLDTDGELLNLSEDITATAASQFEKGVISAADYLSELNSLTRSQLQYELRQIQLIKARITRQNILGQQTLN